MEWAKNSWQSGKISKKEYELYGEMQKKADLEEETVYYSDSWNPRRGKQLGRDHHAGYDAVDLRGGPLRQASPEGPRRLNPARSSLSFLGSIMRRDDLRRS